MTQKIMRYLRQVFKTLPKQETCGPSPLHMEIQACYPCGEEDRSYTLQLADHRCQAIPRARVDPQLIGVFYL